MGVWDRLTGWWKRDDVNRVAEATGPDEANLDEAVEDYESLKDDRSIGSRYIAGGTADFERDSEPPPRP